MLTARADTSVTIPTFEEGRLRYRAPRLDDLDAYAEFRGSERAAGVGGPFSRSSAFGALCALIGHWQVRGFGRWMIADPETDMPLGVVGPFYPEGWPEPEIAWSVFAEAEGKGLAFEAAQFARRHAYKMLGWETVISCTTPANARSIALAKRMGCQRDGEFVHEEAGPLLIWRHPTAEAIS